jgi:hypothetical protein
MDTVVFADVEKKSANRNMRPIKEHLSDRDMTNRIPSRLTKKLNAKYKRQNHLANAATRASMNAEADGSEGRRPRPGKFANPAAPHRSTHCTHNPRPRVKK